MYHEIYTGAMHLIIKNYLILSDTTRILEQVYSNKNHGTYKCHCNFTLGCCFPENINFSSEKIWPSTQDSLLWIKCKKKVLRIEIICFGKRRGGDWYGSLISWDGERKGALGARLDTVTEVLSFCTYNHLVILALLGSYLFSFSGPCHAASGISVSPLGIESGPWQWKHWILSSRPPGSSLIPLIFFKRANWVS